MHFGDRRAKITRFPLIEKWRKRGEVSGKGQKALWDKEIQVKKLHKRAIREGFGVGLKRGLAEMALFSLTQQGGFEDTVVHLPRCCGD